MRRPDVACWVFADMGGSALTFLRYLMRLGRVTTPVVVIAHALFEPLGWNSRPLPERLPGLRGPHLPNLRLVVLEEHITTALARNFPSLLRQHDIRLLPIPLLDVEYACTQPVDAHHFVFPGVPDKGLATFAELAREVHAVQPQANFSVAGFVSGNEDASATAHLTDTPGSPLSIPEYFRRLAAASYTMWFSVHDPNPYQYRTSGTIPDLIACGKPTLFVRNSMVDCYFRRYGAIGYNCDSWPALVQRVKEMCMVNPPVIPAEQHAAVERAREALLPRTLGPVFRDIVLGQKRASSD
ncbi:hypothetical protein DES53_103319 [Roseimicrobium gellanilyticum]|uniref:Glycosyl transferase family 1 n=1 Tax=Roseimicrobium gellanilyticum TaxID=748857 RepID=A0A366HPN4_9BACT|nr:hypothetical protein DES53_103319 [Roseimicrobium gellanilyticum]